MKIVLEFKKEDVWIGVFWKKTLPETSHLIATIKVNPDLTDEEFANLQKNPMPIVYKGGQVTNVEVVKGKFQLDIWICLIPCFPIHITI